MIRAKRLYLGGTVMSYSIHIVEDEENLNHVLTAYLKQEGWEVQSFFNGQSAREKITERPHLWILDIMLPDIDGFQLLKEIKAENEQTPVIFISARDADLDRIMGLEMGSDDYLAKPFLPRELVVRTRKLLERVYGKVEANYQYPPYLIDEKKRTVFERGKVFSLTAKEFDVLLLFIKNKGQAFSREQVLEMIWGNDYFGSDRVVDDLIRRLRKKLPQLNIETIYGFGYRLVEANEK